MTLEPEPRELLASKRVDVVKLQRALFAEIYPKGQRTDAETGKVPEFSSRLLALRLYAARAALSRKSPTSEIIDLLEAFKFESLEQRTGPSPISGVLRDAWDEATYVDATLLGSELARTLLQSQQEERKKLLEKMDALEKQLMQRGLLARIFGGHR